MGSRKRRVVYVHIGRQRRCTREFLGEGAAAANRQKRVG